MPTELGAAHPPDFAGLPMHMSTEDYSLWLRFQPQLFARARRLYFDVKVGGQQALDQQPPEIIAHQWYSANAKRIDVLAELADGVEIIELRTNAQANAIGRLLTYRVLWTDDPKLPGPVAATLVTDRRDDDVRRIAEMNGLNYITV